MNLDELEAEIGQELRRERPSASALEPPREEPEPRMLGQGNYPNALSLEYPQVTAEDIGRITGETVKAVHDAAAESLAELGKEVQARISAIEELKIEAMATMKDLLEVAESYRQAGVDASQRIEAASKWTHEVRDTCNTMRAKLS